MKKQILLFCVSSLFVISCEYEKGPTPIKINAGACDTLVSYSTTIAPITTSKCATSGCHEYGSFNGDFTAYADLKSKADNTTLKNRVITLKDMPPAGSPQLTDRELSKINCWIEQGAPNN